MKRDASRARARRIERVGEVDPCREALAGRDARQETLRQTRRPRRSVADQLGETTPGNTTSEKIVDLGVSRGETATVATAPPAPPFALPVLRHVTAPEGPRELREEVFYAKL